jgi:hypothetical protein
VGIDVAVDQATYIGPPDSDELGDWWQFTVLLQARLGTGAYGDQWDDPIAMPAWVRDSNSLVRDASGAQVVASSTVLVPITCPTTVGVGALVKLPPEFGGRDTVVLEASRNLGQDLPVHVKLACR